MTDKNDEKVTMTRRELEDAIVNATYRGQRIEKEGYDPGDGDPNEFFTWGTGLFLFILACYGACKASW
jgi:hypothetical protein